MEHTKEPWSVYSRDTFYPGIETAEFSVVIWGYEGDEAGVQGHTAEEALANARRIVDCVNACAGMADPAAEIADLRAKLADAVGALKKIDRMNDHPNWFRKSLDEILSETLARIQGEN